MTFRILVIDDNPSIHADIRKILTRTDAIDETLQDGGRSFSVELLMRNGLDQGLKRRTLHFGFEIKRTNSGDQITEDRIGGMQMSNCFW